MDLNQVFPNGGIAAGLVFVMLVFLKRQEAYEQRRDVVVDKVMTLFVTNQEKHEARIDMITDKFLVEIASARADASAVHRDYLERLDRSTGGPHPPTKGR